METIVPTTGHKRFAMNILLTSVAPKQLTIVPNVCVRQSTKLQQKSSDCAITSLDDVKDPEEYKKRLYQELLSRDSEKNVSEHTEPFSLSFKDKNFEHQYRNSRDITSCVSLVGLPLTLFCCLIAYLLIGVP